MLQKKLSNHLTCQMNIENDYCIHFMNQVLSLNKSKSIISVFIGFPAQNYFFSSYISEICSLFFFFTSSFYVFNKHHTELPLIKNYEYYFLNNTNCNIRSLYQETFKYLDYLTTFGKILKLKISSIHLILFTFTILVVS